MMALDTHCYPSGDPVADFKLGGPHFFMDGTDEYRQVGSDGEFLDDVDDAGGFYAGPCIRKMPKDPWGNCY